MLAYELGSRLSPDTESVGPLTLDFCSLICYLVTKSGFLIAQLVKNPPAMQETPVRFLGWEDLQEKG